MATSAILVLNLHSGNGQEAGKEIKNKETETANVVRNGDFEEEQLNWEIGYRDTVNGTWSLDDKIFKTGKKSFKMCPTDSGSPRYFLFQQYHRNLLPGRYLFEGWCRVSDDCNGVPFIAMNVATPLPGENKKYENKYYSVRVPDNAPCNEWTRLNKELDIPENAVMNIQIFVSGTRGTAWFDGFSLRRIQ